MKTEERLINIIESPIISVYLHELYYLCESIRRECEEIFNEARVPDQGYLIQISPVLHSRINAVLIYSANIKKLLTTKNEKSKKESRTKFQLRKQRETLFKSFLADIDIQEIMDSKVRNTIEHFEEYLDDLAVQLEKPKNKIKKNHIHAAYNMTFSDWKITDPEVYPLRLYITSGRKLYNFDWSVDIGKIYDEALRIIEKLKTLQQFKEDEDEPGGLLVKL